MSPPRPQFSRRRPPSFSRWAAAGAAALILHAAVLAVLALWPQSSPRKKSPHSEKQYVVHLHRPTVQETRPSSDARHVSTEDSAVPWETRNKDSDSVQAPVRPRNPQRPRMPATAPLAAPAIASLPEPAAVPAAETPKEVPAPPTAPQGPIKLFPTEEEAQKILGIQPESAPPDVADGSETSLNSRKWIGASFFLRVREAVARTWDPERVYRANDPDGRVYGYKNWLTVLTITLDARGNLLEPVIISQPSGLRFLDLEAIRAVRSAAPFLNPPPEIVDETGRIKFRFGFLVEVNAGLNFRMFRF